MKIRAIVVAMLIALLTMAASAVSAQDACFGLAAEDCAAIGEASANTGTATSFFQTFSFEFSVTGVPGGDIALSAAGEGPVAMNTSAAFPFNLATTIAAAATNADGTEESIELEIRAIDGILYLQNPETGEWGGVDIAEVMNNPQALGLPIDPSQLSDPSTMGIDAEALGAALPSLVALMETPGFLTYTRDGDTYTFIADIGVLLQAPEYAEASASLSQALAGNPEAAQFAGMLPVLPMLLSEGQIVVTQVVDPELNAVTGLGFDVNGVVNSAMAGGDASAAPINISLSFYVELSDLDGEFTFEVPADAQMMPMGN